MSQASQQNIEVVPVAGRIGAEIRGVRLSADLPPETVERIRSAWLQHKVVFFRGQHHLDDIQQESLTALFGAGPVTHPRRFGRGFRAPVPAAPRSRDAARKHRALEVASR
jgi:alpha-ketoglutarate-dependent taurine dioxygenase